MVAANGGYTGGSITTPSPGLVVTRRSSAMPVTTSATTCTSSRATSQPHRSFAHGAKAAPSEHGEAKAEGGEKGHGAAAGPGPMVRLADFISPLRNPEAERYARISFEIEVGSDLDKDKMAGHLPQIRETFIAYLSDQTLEDLRGSEGIKKTKEALFEKLRSIAPEASPRAIFITDLVIQ